MNKDLLDYKENVEVLDHLAHKDLLVAEESQAYKEHKDLEVNVDLQDPKGQEGKMVIKGQLDLQDHLDREVHLEREVCKDLLDHKVTVEIRENKDDQEELAPEDPVASAENLVNQGPPDQEVLPDPLDHKEEEVKMDLQDRLDQEETEESVDLRVNKDHLDHKAHPDLMAQPDDLAALERPAQEEEPESPELTADLDPGDPQVCNFHKLYKVVHNTVVRITNKNKSSIKKYSKLFGQDLHYYTFGQCEYNINEPITSYQQVFRIK